MNGQRVVYVRISTFEQHAERQLDGVELDRLFIDKASGKDRLLSRIAPLGWNHINPTGDYVWHANKRVAKGAISTATHSQIDQDQALAYKKIRFLRSPLRGHRALCPAPETPSQAWPISALAGTSFRPEYHAWREIATVRQARPAAVP